MFKSERTLILSILALLTILWFIGDKLENRRIEKTIRLSIKQTGEIKKKGSHLFYSSRSNAMIALGIGQGYGGPLQVLVSLSQSGHITEISVISNRESVPFFRKLVEQDSPNKMIGKRYSDPFTPGKDIDTVSGATLSLKGLVLAVRNGAVRAAVNGFGLPPLQPSAKTIHFGLKELLLILLFLTGLLNYSKKIGHKSRQVIRWSTMLTGMTFLGFIYAAPLSIININSFILGFWPGWQQHIFWYLLLLLVFLPIFLIGKSPYCDGFCPFGTAQEILKIAGGGKMRLKGKIRNLLKFLQRMLALLIIGLALVSRKPGIGNFEVFGTFFKLTGNEVQYAMMAVIVILSLIFTRPWCNYLCPIRAVSDFVKKGRVAFKRKIKR